MTDITTQQEAPAEGIQITEETARMAAIGRGEIEPPKPADPDAPAAPAAEEPAKPTRPDYVPEKFWDAEKGEVRLEQLVKSYGELEKTRNPNPGVKVGEPAAEETPAAEAVAAAEAIPPATLFQEAQTEYAASNGELSSETREKIIAAGIDSATLDTYLAGVKALEVQMTNEVYSLAGGTEAYNAAVEYARKNWSPEQIEAFDNALGNPALRSVAVTGLVAAAQSAGASTEGVLTVPGGGIDHGDVYTDKDQFLKDLDTADKAKDQVARKAAVQKLERSKKAGTLKNITPRSGLASFG